MTSEHSLWEKASHIAGYISLLVSAMALYTAWQTNARDQRYAHIISEVSDENLESPFTRCKPVKLAFRNLSKYASPIEVEI